MSINIPLLRKVLDHITAHPDEWDQGSWAIQTDSSPCGTAFCVAGHAAVMRGHEIAWVPGALPVYYTRSGEAIDTVAVKELGLNMAQSAHLFAPDNSLADLWYLAEVYTDGAINAPEGITAEDSIWFVDDDPQWEAQLHRTGLSRLDPWSEPAV